MVEGSVRSWARPYDWAEVVFGVVAALSPIWLTTDNAALWTLIVLGVLVAADGLVSLAAPDMVFGEGVQIVLGALLFISPWIMGFSDMSGAAWTSWIIGALTLIAGALALPVANAGHHKMVEQH
jgi:uncharacterized membrane protein HdeD (DUF308 family)